MAVKNNLSTNITDFLGQKALAIDRPDYVVGFADVAHIVDLINKYVPYTTAISFGLVLDPQVVSHMADGLTQEHLDEFDRVDAHLQNLGNNLKFYLEKLGYQAMTFEDALAALNETGGSQSDAPLLDHKIIAANAGLGWVGKGDFVVTKRYGGAVRLSTVFTNAPIECCTQSFLSRCGRCTDCIDEHPDELGFYSCPYTKAYLSRKGFA